MASPAVEKNGSIDTLRENYYTQAEVFLDTFIFCLRRRILGVCDIPETGKGGVFFKVGGGGAAEAFLLKGAA
ncbi:MAG: hypothetical protein SOV63_07880 [Pyramidobacter porci]|uniref:hypothetical protein n=1 Tax=Pyramidobacter porci TaxID=2605789 RepID=UPI002A76683A|nr:hypothetical protein [Pyramidobacter porci]MDY2648709.1 hypothetical protein [Pyramidobacter porci]